MRFSWQLISALLGSVYGTQHRFSMQDNHLLFPLNIYLCPLNKCPSGLTSYQLTDKSLCVEHNIDNTLLPEACVKLVQDDTVRRRMHFLVQGPRVSAAKNLSRLIQVPSSWTSVSDQYGIISIFPEHLEELDVELTRMDVKREWINLRPDDTSPTTWLTSSCSSSSLDATVQHFQDLFISKLQEKTYDQVLSHLTGKTPMPSSGTALLTRYTFAPEHIHARDYLIAFFKALPGMGPVKYQEYELYGASDGQVATAYNVIAERRGSTFPDDIIVVGAHFDATSEIPYQRAPGAVDDGSGTAGVLTLAEAFFAALEESKDLSMRTVQFVLFSGEEQGLLGSKHFVQQAQMQDRRIVAALLMDMICFSKRYFGVKVEGTPQRANMGLMQVVVKNMKKFAPVLSLESTTRSFGSDHVSFQRAGIPAVLVIEKDDTVYPNYHKSTDVYNADSVNLKQTMSILRGMAGAMVELLAGCQ